MADERTTKAVFCNGHRGEGLRPNDQFDRLPASDAAPHWTSIRNAAVAVSAIGAVLHRDMVARECEDEGDPLDNSVLDGLHAGIEELGDLIVARLDTLERQCFGALSAGAGERPE